LNYQRTVDFSYLNNKEPSITVLWGKKEKKKKQNQRAPHASYFKNCNNLAVFSKEPV
jgi:hypothetical protein